MPLTDYVIMPSADYTAACDKIREKSGKTDPIKSGDLAAEIEEVAGGVGNTQEKTVSITENGTTEVLPDNGYALSKVTINANVKQNYCAVRFYNDDRTTLLYTAYVPYGGNAVYAGDRPISTENARYGFEGFEPSAENVTADLDCYAVYDGIAIGTLDQCSWAQISAMSEAGTAENYFSVGECKAVTLKGTVGTLELDATYYAYILGFNHNSELEGNGIHFGTFLSAASGGVDVCLVDGFTSTSTSGTKYFNINHKGNYNHSGWSGCDLRYDILGSTDVAPSNYGSAANSDRVGYDASPTCATNPVSNTLMAALPAELRSVMKPMTKYTDGVGNRSNTEENVIATIDYLPLLGEFEVFGKRSKANQYEQNKQKQYDYFVNGNMRNKYKHTDTTKTNNWWLRSSAYDQVAYFCSVYSYTTHGDPTPAGVYYSLGLAPIFKV